MDVVVSDGGIDGEDFLSEVLNEWTDNPRIAPKELLEVTRDLATTQYLNVTAQLDNGVRFLDFRIMREEHEGGQWRCLHLLQTVGIALDYMKQIRNWLEEHPTEVVVVWLSKHGNDEAVGNDQFPSVTIKQKRAFWENITSIFSGLLFDTKTSSIRDTPLRNLVARNHRLVIMASDYSEFTGNSSLALDTIQILDNDLISNYPLNTSCASVRSQFATGRDRRAVDFASERFWLMSLSGDGPTVIDEYVFELRVLGEGSEGVTKKCAAVFGIPNLTNWCPMTLTQEGQLRNYYRQRNLDEAYDRIIRDEDGWALPNAFYVDVFDEDGTIRVGTAETEHGPSRMSCDHEIWTDCESKQSVCPDGYVATGEKEHFDCVDTDGTAHGTCILPWQSHFRCCKAPQNQSHSMASYGLVDMIVATNVHVACRGSTNITFDDANGRDSARVPSACEVAIATVTERKKRHPVVVWNDENSGRLVDYPPM